MNAELWPRLRWGCALAASLGIVSACDSASKPADGAPPPAPPPRTHQFSAQAYSGVVIEDDGGAPIGGVNVVAFWYTLSGMHGHVTNIAVSEAVTDEQGVFSLPAWGPKAVTNTAGLNSAAPTILLFKAGYERGGGQGLGSYSPSTYVNPSWDGKTFKLKKFQGTPGEYERYLSLYLRQDVNGFLRDCLGRDIPRLLVAMDRLSADLQKPPTATMSLGYLSRSHAQTCGPIEEAVRASVR